MNTFYRVLANTLIASVTNNFVWFAITFWVYLETNSVLATSIVGGIYLVANAACGFWFGAIVDRNKKKRAMMLSSLASLALFVAGFALYLAAPEGIFKEVESAWLWSLVFILLCGVIAGNIRSVALPTLVTILIPEKDRDKANGLSGTMFGVSFSITSFASGLILAFFGMHGVLLTAIAFTLLALLDLSFVTIPEKEIVHVDGAPKNTDIKGTIKAIGAIPGLFALLFFNTFNNFLGGVFMSLMDAYGLSLVSVKVWGGLWGVLSLGFIIGGLYIAKKGLGPTPLRTLFTVNIILWTLSTFFAIQPWIWLLAGCMFIYICLIPFVEAAEQTIIQRVVPLERQGRVFGFAQSIESAASPLTAFLIGPIAQFIFIPFMTTGAGVDLIGDWFGTGQGRGIALVFTITGIIGFIVTIIAMRSSSYKVLAKTYKNAPAAA